MGLIWARWGILGGKSCFHLRTRLEAADSLHQMIWKQGTSSIQAKHAQFQSRIEFNGPRTETLGFFRLIDPVGEVFFFKTLDLQPLRASWWQLRQPEWSQERLLKWTASTERTSDPTSVQCRDKQLDKFMIQSNQRQPISHLLRPKAMNTHWETHCKHLFSNLSNFEEFVLIGAP